MVLLSITGLIRTLLIIVGVFVLFRFIGRLMIAKRNLDEHQRVNRDMRNAQKKKADAQRNFGKVSISKIDKRKMNDGDYVEYEEVD